MANPACGVAVDLSSVGLLAFKYLSCNLFKNIQFDIKHNNGNNMSLDVLSGHVSDSFDQIMASLQFQENGNLVDFQLNGSGGDGGNENVSDDVSAPAASTSSGALAAATHQLKPDFTSPVFDIIPLSELRSAAQFLGKGNSPFDPISEFNASQLSSGISNLQAQNVDATCIFVLNTMINQLRLEMAKIRQSSLYGILHLIQLRENVESEKKLKWSDSGFGGKKRKTDEQQIITLPSFPVPILQLPQSQLQQSQIPHQQQQQQQQQQLLMQQRQDQITPEVRQQQQHLQQKQQQQQQLHPRPTHLPIHGGKQIRKEHKEHLAAVAAAAVGSTSGSSSSSGGNKRSHK